jgi:hypothetical protein
MMPPFSPLMFPHKVTFRAGAYSTGQRGGLESEETPGAMVAAYVEAIVAEAPLAESPFHKRQSRTSYRVFTPANPATGLSREIQEDDHIVWVDTGFILRIQKPPVPQLPLWFTAAERIA